MDNNLSNEEQKIVDVLQERFDPQAIILVGSQVNGTATPKSDWDVFLFCGKWRLDEQIEIDGINIDANFAGWPADDQYLDAGFGPVSPVRILYDQTDGHLEKLLENTRIAYDKGPQMFQSDDCAHNLRSIGRNIAKLQKHIADPEVQFYYKGKFYELFLKVWFEQQNKWAPSPAQAIKIISTDQPETFLLMQKFVDNIGTVLVDTAQSLLASIKSNEL